MKKTNIIEKKETLEIIENLFDRLDYYERDTQQDIETFREELSCLDESEQLENWRTETIEKLNIKLKAIEKIQTALEKLI